MALALPDGPRGRLLALGMTLAAVLALWLGVVSPVLSFYADRAERLERREALARRMEGLAASLPTLRAQASAAAASAPPEEAMLAGATDAIAGAALQGVVQDLVARAGATLASTEVLPVEQRGAYRRIGLRVSLEAATWPVVVRVLAAIAEGQPRMLVDDTQLTALPIRARANNPQINATFSVYAFRPGTEEGGAPPKAGEP